MNLFATFILLVPAVLCNPLLRRQTRNDNSGLLGPSHNACDDPNPNPVDTTDVDSDGIVNLEPFLIHLRDTSIHVRDKLVNGTQHIEHRTHCQNIVDGMRELDITNFVTIETSIAEYQNNVTRQYFEMRHLMYLFETLVSPWMGECCLYTSSHYHHIKNRLLGKWAILNSRYGQHIQGATCCMSATVELNRQPSCETVRDLAYTVLREGISTINLSLVFLETWIGIVAQ